MTESTVINEAVRVEVTPSQASYFAGEVFTVTITIMNIRTQEVQLPTRATSQSASYAHKRGAHSVSYVPMARPPTSPGIRTAISVVSASPITGSSSARRGLVGRPFKGMERLSQAGEPPRRRPTLTKSLSISLTPQGFGNNLPRIPSPLGRSASLPQNHPHARKQSVLDGQVHFQDIRASEHVPSSLTPTPTPSPSTFSLSLASITEGSASPLSPATPNVKSPVSNFIQLPAHTPASVNVKQNDITNGVASATSRLRRPPHLGIGHDPLSSENPRTDSAKAANFSSPNAELVLYSYAQLLGTVTLVPQLDTTPSVEQARNFNVLRRELQSTKAIGGGSMNIASNGSNTLANGGRLSASKMRQSSHTRSVSLSSGLFSLLSPSPPLPFSPPIIPQPRRASGHARSPSIFSGFFSSSSGLASDLDATDSSTILAEEDAEDTDTPLPTFDVPPAMLAIDLNLEPGQSRSCMSVSIPNKILSPNCTVPRPIYPPAASKSSTDISWTHATVPI